MIGTQMPTDDLFLFKEANRAFLEGKSLHPVSLSSTGKMIRSFVFLWVLIALPSSLIAAVLASLTAKADFLLLFMFSIIIMTLIFLYPIINGYYIAQRLVKYGTVYPGKIVSYTLRLTVGAKGYRKGMLMNYEVQTRRANIPLSSSISQSTTHLPDGRALPEVGAKIAVIYLDGHPGVPL